MSDTLNLEVVCPKCNSQSTKHIPEMEKYICLTCAHLFGITKKNEMNKLKVFLSYGHDIFTEDAYAIKKDIESRGHEVWYDADQLKAGRDFELYIENGLKWCDIVVVVMTPHSVRRENSHDVGYCLNEIAKALDLNRRIIPIYLVTVAGEAPTSICRLGYVDMRDCVHFKDFPEKYRLRFAHLIDAIENEKYEGDGAQSRLLNLLKPLAFEVEMGRHLTHFTGRQWLTLELDRWLNEKEKKGSRVFWLLGGAGVGKSAIASHWCHTRGDVIAYHLCVYGHSEKADPKRILLSIAAQMAMHLPEYFKRLSALPLEDLVKKNAKAVFDDLLVAPLKGNFPNPSRDLLVIIDALDEASHGNENELADFINESWGDLPTWLKLIITSRPETSVLTRLAALQPWSFKAERIENLLDIKEYLKHEFENIAPSATDVIVDKVVKKSEGLFLYANLIVEEIRVGKLSVNEFSDFPTGLAGYYNRWFRREFHDIVEYEKTYHRIVSTIIAQRAPLPLEVLFETVGLSAFELHKRLHKLAVLFPLREDRDGEQLMTTIQPLHKSLRDWLTEMIAGTQTPKAGDFAADIEMGDQLLSERGWVLYTECKIIQNFYYSRTLLRHLAGTRQIKRLTTVLLDGELLESLWSGDQRCEWLRQMNSLRESISLKETINKWLEVHFTPPIGKITDAAKMAILSRLLQQLGAFNESIQVAEEANRIWELNGVTDSPSMLKNLLSQATIYRLRDEFDKAQLYYERALSIAEGVLSQNSSEMADVLYELCVFHKEKRNYEKSWDCLNRCLTIRKQLLPYDYAGIADCINDQAVLLNAEGKPADYLGIYREALSLFEKGFPEGHPEMATTLENIASELVKEGKSEEALATLKRGLQMAESLLIPHHPKCRSLRNDLVNLLYDLEKYQDALYLMRNQILQSEIFPGYEHPDTAETRLRLCQTIRYILWYDEKAHAEDLRSEVQEHCKKVFKASPLTVIGFLRTSDKFYLSAEQEIAENLFKAACQGSQGFAKMMRNDSAENIASICFSQIVNLVISNNSLSDLTNKLLQIWEVASEEVKDRGDRLARMRREVISLISWAGSSRLLRFFDVTEVKVAFELISNIGSDTPETLDELAILSVSLHNQRYFEEGAILCKILLERSEKLLGIDHIQTISYVENLADLQEHLGNNKDAALLYRRAFDLHTKVYGNEDYRTIFDLSCVLTCMYLENHFEEATTLVNEFTEKLENSNASNLYKRNLALRMCDGAIKLKNELSAYDASKRCYELSLELFPDNAQIESNLALLLWSCLNENIEADIHFQKALQLNPNNGNIHSNYGLFLTHATRDYSQAQIHLEQAMNLVPNDNAIPGNYSTLLILLGNLDTAWILAKRAMHLCLPQPDRIMARPLFCATSILMLKGKNADIPLGQLHTLLKNGIDHVSWVITALLERLEKDLPYKQYILLCEISEAINSHTGLEKLEANPDWQIINPILIDMPWN